MGKNYIHNKFIKKQTEKTIDTDNVHSKDGMPKNKPSKYITTHSSVYPEWVQEPTYCGGHKIQKNGHRIVSGLVRAKTKEESNKIIQEQLIDDNI